MRYKFFATDDPVNENVKVEKGDEWCRIGTKKFRSCDNHIGACIGYFKNSVVRRPVKFLNAGFGSYGVDSFTSGVTPIFFPFVMGSVKGVKLAEPLTFTDFHAMWNAYFGFKPEEMVKEVKKPEVKKTVVSESKVDENEAPEGYIAVEGKGTRSNDCRQCAKTEKCGGEHNMFGIDCSSLHRKDKKDVYFVPRTPELDPTEAPEGYIAVEREYFFGCTGCALRGDRLCRKVRCSSSVRKDKKDVYFVPRTPELDPTEAPEGYIAVESTFYCTGCALRGDRLCLKVRCRSTGRKDKTSVIFKKVGVDQSYSPEGYTAIEQDGCSGCALISASCDCLKGKLFGNNNSYLCSSLSRKDKTSVIFKKVFKPGDKVTINAEVHSVSPLNNTLVLKFKRQGLTSHYLQFDSDDLK